MANEEKKNGATQLPAGFEESAPAKVWIKPVEGLKVQGILLEREERKGKDAGKSFYAIEITELHNLTVGHRGSKEEKEQVKLKKGDIVYLDERARLSHLKEMVESNDKYEVCIIFIDKTIETDNGMAWRVMAGHKKVGTWKNEDRIPF